MASEWRLVNRELAATRTPLCIALSNSTRDRRISVRSPVDIGVRLYRDVKPGRGHVWFRIPAGNTADFISRDNGIQVKALRNGGTVYVSEVAWSETKGPK